MEVRQDIGEFEIVGLGGSDSSTKQFKGKAFSVEGIHCLGNNSSQMACFDQRCLSYPFFCDQKSNCTKCSQSHSKCMAFIELQKFIDQILSKNVFPEEISQFLSKSFDKWIDMISETLISMQSSLKSYGLTKSEEQLFDHIQERKFYNITGPKLKKILRQMHEKQFQPNTPKQLMEILKIQVQKTTDTLRKQMSKFDDILSLARQGKAFHHMAKISGLSEKWIFDKTYKYSQNFRFQQDGKMVIKSMQHGMYSHVIGNKRFNSTKMSEFSVKITNSDLNFMMFGIGTKKIDREDAHESKDAILYLSYNGTIWHKGQHNKAGQKLKINDMATVRYDPLDKKVYWLKNYKILASHVVPQKMSKYDLYPVYCLFSNSDVLHVVDYDL